jgi:F0F1-type ATP synthase assembly protein I
VVAALGLSLTIALAGVAWLVWGVAAITGTLAFGALATVLQLAASAAMRPALARPFPDLMRRWALGIGLRLAGIVLFAAAVAVDRQVFHPLPSALGYVGVLIPLLIVETRLLR